MANKEKNIINDANLVPLQGLGVISPFPDSYRGVRGFLLLLLVFFIQFLSAQSPKREMRATWLTTVWRLDWPSTTVPSATGTNEAARQVAIQTQKNDLIKILDALKAANMNATFMQVRSMCDAMYQSSYEPWSQFISSERGANPGYDPLAYAIEEAHKRGIELHAWLNPYRYSTSQTTHGELPTDYFHTNRNWLLAYDSYTKILNPGLPQVVQQIKKVVGEVVNNYDVDGIIFDDYFYAYGGTSNTLDAAEQALYKPANQSIGDWRRANVNRMIAAVYDTIQKVKPFVTFGVSPFGTWTTSQTVAASRGIILPSGVGTTGDMYSQIYCDPVAWLEEGTVDYISPQLYWTTYSAYPYGKLAPWWSELSNRFGKHFYSSHSISAMTSGSAAPPAPKIIQIDNEEISLNGLSTLEQDAAVRAAATTNALKAPEATNFSASEVGLQIDFNRTGDMNDAPGSVFYATAKFVNTAGFINYLKTTKFTQPALPPAIGWKKANEQGLVENLSAAGQLVSWNYTGTNVRFAVYAVPNENRNDANVFYKSENFLGIAYDKQFVLPATISVNTHKIALSVIDRYGNEFASRVLGENAASAVTTTLVFPANNSEVLLPAVFTWNAVESADCYVWQLSRDEQFADLVCSRETTQPQFFSGLQTNIKDNVNYYWRVKSRKANSPDTWSQARKFSGQKFKITSPVNGSGGNSLTPTITWDNVSPTAVYTLEVSTALDFNVAKQVLKQVLSTPTFTVPANLLLSSTGYYARVSVADGIVQATTETILFTTQDIVVPIPQISKPLNNANLFGKSIEVCWDQQPSNGFRAELSKDPTFPARATTAKTLDAFTYCVTYDALSSSTYYIQVKAATVSGLTEPSGTVTVILTDNTDIKNQNFNQLKCFIRSVGIETNQLVIQSDDTFSGTIFLSNLTGSVIFQSEMTITEGTTTVNIENKKLPKGVYILTVKSSNNTNSFKIIN